MTRPKLRDLAAQAVAEKLAAMTPEERIEYDDPDGSKRREAAEQAARAHAWEMFEQSPLYRWFPTVAWGVADYPSYPVNSIVVYDTEELRNRHTAYFMIEWDEMADGGPGLTFKVTSTTSGTDTDTGYTYWSTGGRPLWSAAEVGEMLAKWKT